MLEAELRPGGPRNKDLATGPSSLDPGQVPAMLKPHCDFHPSSEPVGVRGLSPEAVGELDRFIQSCPRQGRNGAVLLTVTPRPLSGVPQKGLMGKHFDGDLGLLLGASASEPGLSG